jgi:hypothetical protein
MTARSISPDLVAALKRLRLGGLLPTLADRFSLAEKEDTPYEDLLCCSSSMRSRGETARRRSAGPTWPGWIPTWCWSAGTSPRR